MPDTERHRFIQLDEAVHMGSINIDETRKNRFIQLDKSDNTVLSNWIKPFHWS